MGGILCTEQVCCGWQPFAGGVDQIQFAQFAFITEAMVRHALPDPSVLEPRLAVAIGGFLARYKAERARVEAKYPEPVIQPGP